jgi:hypothetical protein
MVICSHSIVISDVKRMTINDVKQMTKYHYPDFLAG